MFGISHWGILLILVVALLLFGNRLPEVARSMGRAMNEFKRGLREVGDDMDLDGDDRHRLHPPKDDAGAQSVARSTEPEHEPKPEAEPEQTEKPEN